MKLIQARATANRLVNTKFGEKRVIDALTQDGQTVTLWRPVDDLASRSIVNGSRIQVGIDSKGKASLIEAPGDRASVNSEISPIVSGQTIPARPMGFDIDVPFGAERKLRQQLAAVKQLDTTAMAIPEVKDVATTLFIQTCKHFQL